jgi:hypothetical protein
MQPDDKTTKQQLEDAMRQLARMDDHASQAKNEVSREISRCMQQLNIDEFHFDDRRRTRKNGTGESQLPLVREACVKIGLDDDTIDDIISERRPLPSFIPVHRQKRGDGPLIKNARSRHVLAQSVVEAH